MPPAISWRGHKNSSFYVNLSISSFVLLEKQNLMTHPIFAVIFPLKMTWPLICTITRGRFVSSLIEIGQRVLEKIFKDFFQYTHM
jgi:hypothetical protein